MLHGLLSKQTGEAADSTQSCVLCCLSSCFEFVPLVVMLSVVAPSTFLVRWLTLVTLPLFLQYSALGEHPHGVSIDVLTDSVVADQWEHLVNATVSCNGALCMFALC